MTAGEVYVKPYNELAGGPGMKTSFEEFIDELEAEVRAEGPQAWAEWEQMGSHLRFAAQFARLRLERSLTQAQLSERSGVRQGEISRLEAGKGNPSRDTLFRVARALGAELRLVPVAEVRSRVSGHRRRPQAKAARVARANAPRRASHRALRT